MASTIIEKDVIIIGAGMHGLCAAKSYLQLHPTANITILEGGNSLGGVWSTERLYPELYAQVSHGFFEFSDLPMKKENLSPDGYLSGIAINQYLHEYAEKFDLKKLIQYRTWVKRVERLPEGNGWALRVRSAKSQNETEQDCDQIMTCRKLVMAIGTANKPEIPDIPRHNFNGQIEHSQKVTEFVKAMDSPSIQRITVVGAAKASYDAVYLAMRAGKHVDWIIRPKGRGPLPVYPPTMFGINSMRIGFSRMYSKFSPSIDATEDWWYHTLHTTTFGILITQFFWMVATLICSFYAGYSRSENAAKLRPEPDSVFWCNAGCGMITNTHFWDLFHNSGLVTVHRHNIVSFVDDSVEIDDESRSKLKSDYVLFCTGWKDDLSMFSKAEWTMLGLPYFDKKNKPYVHHWETLEATANATIDEKFPILADPPPTNSPIIPNRNVWRQYRRMVPPQLAAEGDNSIVFLGQIYIMQTILHAEVQSLWAAAYLLGRLKVPELDVMEQEVANWNSWTRKRYLHRGNSMPYAIYDQLACCDRLLRDLNIPSVRKTNWFSELFSAYRPSDYTGIVSEFIAAEAHAAELQNAPAYIKSDVPAFKKSTLQIKSLHT